MHLSFFIVAILTFYGIMHVILYRTISQAFALPQWVRVAFIPAAVALILPVFLSRMWYHDQPTASFLRCYILAGYMWLLILFWLLGLCAVKWLWNGSLCLVTLAHPPARRLMLNARVFFHLAFALLVLCSLAGLLEANRFQVREIVIQAPQWPAQTPALHVAHVSDLHLEPWRGESYFRRVAAAIEQRQPDLLLCTGDMIDAPLSALKASAATFQHIRPPLGKYAVLGNHEFYLGVDESLRFYAAAGFTVLRDQATLCTPQLRLAGVDDNRRHTPPTVAAALFPPVSSNVFTLLLQHQPVITDAARAHVNLQLSGHTHGGQCFPFAALVRLKYPYLQGLYRLSDTFTLYVNQGIGTWGPPVRLFAPPEITMITIQGGKTVKP